MNKISYLIISVMMVTLLGGCALFTSHYDATRHENFTKLKAVHFKLFDDWNEKSNKEWNVSEITSYCNNGYLRFREAHEFAKSKDKADNTGQKAVKILWDQFVNQCSFLLTKKDNGQYKKNLFNQYDKDNLIPVVEQNYTYAIDGEEARVKN